MHTNEPDFWLVFESDGGLEAVASTTCRLTTRMTASSPASLMDSTKLTRDDASSS